MGEKDHSDQALAGDGGLSYASAAAIDAVRRASSDPIERAALFADVCRLNTLYMIMQAGSGHIGSSFSSTDLITWLWTETLADTNSGAPGAIGGAAVDDRAAGGDRHRAGKVCPHRPGRLRGGGPGSVDGCAAGATAGGGQPDRPGPRPRWWPGCKANGPALAIAQVSFPSLAAVSVAIVAFAMFSVLPVSFAIVAGRTAESQRPSTTV